jgi:hypothetical protein
MDRSEEQLTVEVVNGAFWSTAVVLWKFPMLVHNFKKLGKNNTCKVKDAIA